MAMQVPADVDADQIKSVCITKLVYIHILSYILLHYKQSKSYSNNLTSYICIS